MDFNPRTGLSGAVMLALLALMTGCATGERPTEPPSAETVEETEAARRLEEAIERDHAILPPAARLDQENAALAGYDWTQPARQWRLPEVLDEISGLARLGEDRLLAHHDNDSQLWTLNPGGRLIAHPLPSPHPVLDGDFEGMTLHDGHVYLLGSPGLLYRARLNAAATALAGPWRPVASAVQGRCNFEGLAAAPDSGALYLACKYPRRPRDGTILLYRLDAAGRALALPVDVSPVLDALSLQRLRPSDMVWLPDLERLLILVGKEHVILEVDAAGVLRAWRRLPRRHHRQAEGLSVSAQGTLVIGDEADGAAATLSVYPRVPEKGPVGPKGELVPPEEDLAPPEGDLAPRMTIIASAWPIDRRGATGGAAKSPRSLLSPANFATTPQPPLPD